MILAGGCVAVRAVQGLEYGQADKSITGWEAPGPVMQEKEMRSVSS